MSDMASHISIHNKSIIQESKKSQHLNPKMCDWQVVENCPLNRNCQQSAVIYQADATPEVDNEHNYIGLTEGNFKDRLSDHHTSFRDEQNKYNSPLSSFFWEMKNKAQNFKFRWLVIRRSNTYKAGSKKCNLYLWEKFHIMTGDKDKLLNGRNELSTKYRHADKFLPKNYKSRRRERGRGKGRGQ